MTRPLLLTALLAAAALPAAAARTVSAQWGPGAVRATLESVAEWQLDHPSKYPATDWTQAAMYVGMMSVAGVSPDLQFREAMRAMGEGSGWQTGPRLYHADDHCVGQTYVELYELYREEKMLVPLRARFDEILAQPATNSLEFKGPHGEITKQWSWCDALFMAPPAWLRLYRATGEARYRDFAVSNWWAASDFLYDREEHLFYRDSRYFPQREANGKKVFWSRGNGWVFAGLARVLQVLPAEDPARPRFVAQFQEMAAAVLASQQPDGLWRSSLLDPDSYPLRETSGTGFFTFGLAWGINQGLLDRAAHLPAVRRGWEGLVKCVDAEGRLSHVQPIGADPKKFDETHTDVYGVGAFLLAGSELYRLVLAEVVPPVRVQVRNPIDARRGPVPVELPWGAIVERLPGAAAGAVSVMDAATSKLIDVQPLDENGDQTPERLLFQAEFMPGETRAYLLAQGPDWRDRPAPALTTFARFVPERLDDFAWENDRIAFRAYGPALQATPGEVSGSGIDVWLKSTRRPVIDAWYASGDYHTDHGEGLDAYKVGVTRGCGGLAIRAGDTFAASANFAEWKLLAAGPIRALFELTYAPWAAGERTVSEVRRVALDRGSNWSRMESLLVADPPGALDVAAGIVLREGKGELLKADAEGWLAYTEPALPEAGRTHTALVVTDALKTAPDPAHWMITRRVAAGEPFVYWAGAGWSRADHPTPASWQRAVQLFAWEQRHPLELAWPAKP